MGVHGPGRRSRGRISGPAGCWSRAVIYELNYKTKVCKLVWQFADPYGLKILSVYMKGSKNMSYDAINLTTPDIKWLGVRPSDLEKYKIPPQCRLEMSEHDLKTGKELLEEDFIKANPLWHKELEMMVKSKIKAEIQALSSFGFQYLSQVFLPQKLKAAGFETHMIGKGHLVRPSLAA